MTRIIRFPLADELDYIHVCSFLFAGYAILIRA